MKTPDIPDNEILRLDALKKAAILDTPPEERFDRLTRLAKQVFNVPIALISLIDEERQWFKSRQGLPREETSRDISFCGHAILGEDIFYVPNAAEDSRFADNPLVTGAPNIRFYAGAPLSTNGYRIGTLCIIDEKPRDLTEQEYKSLRDIADCVEEEILRTSLYQQHDTASKLLQNIKESEHALLKEQHLTAALLNAAGAIIIVLDTEGRIVRFNPAAETITGYLFEDIKGDYFWKYFLSEDKHQGVMQVFNNISSGNIVTRYENHWLMRDGSKRLFDWSNNVLTNNKDEIEYIVSIGIDITDQHSTQEALKQSEERLRGLFELSPLGITLNDYSTGDFVEINDAIVAPTGYTKDEFTRLSYWDITPKEYEQQEAIQLESLEKTGRYGPYEKEYIRKDGTRYPVVLNGMLVHDSSGKKMIWSMIEDISERKRIEVLKNEFISTVSHELRTPLTSISGAIGLIAGGVFGGLPAEVNQNIQIAKNNAERLTNIIDDLLDVEKLSAGKMNLNMRPHELISQVQTSINNNLIYAEQYKVKLKFSTDIKSLNVNIDAQRLQQILANLISNAVKYSDKNTHVLITVTRHANMARIAITDYGAGIPDEYQDVIFEKFAQVDSSDTKQRGGTGLGLAITRELVEQMHGKIGLTSVEGAGSTFYFELPVIN